MGWLLAHLAPLLDLAPLLANPTPPGQRQEEPLVSRVEVL